jgi:uncharacterized protein YdcH (DUF465 family)
MSVEHHPLLNEFPEYRDRIHQLKMDNAHFKKLFDEYHEVDKEVYRMDENIEPSTDEAMEEMKKRRLALKDELYGMLKAD